MSRLWDDHDATTPFEPLGRPGDLDLRDVDLRAALTLRSTDACVALTVVIDARSDVVQRVTVTGVCGCRCGALVAGHSPVVVD